MAQFQSSTDTNPDATREVPSSLKDMAAPEREHVCGEGCEHARRVDDSLTDLAQEMVAGLNVDDATLAQMLSFDFNSAPSSELKSSPASSATASQEALRPLETVSPSRENQKESTPVATTDTSIDAGKVSTERASERTQQDSLLHSAKPTLLTSESSAANGGARAPTTAPEISPHVVSSSEQVTIKEGVAAAQSTAFQSNTIQSATARSVVEPSATKLQTSENSAPKNTPLHSSPITTPALTSSSRESVAQGVRERASGSVPVASNSDPRHSSSLKLSTPTTYHAQRDSPAARPTERIPLGARSSGATVRYTSDGSSIKNPANVIKSIATSNRSEGRSLPSNVSHSSFERNSLRSVLTEAVRLKSAVVSQDIPPARSTISPSTHTNESPQSSLHRGTRQELLPNGTSPNPSQQHAVIREVRDVVREAKTPLVVGAKENVSLVVKSSATSSSASLLSTKTRGTVPLQNASASDTKSVSATTNLQRRTTPATVHATAASGKKTAVIVEAVSPRRVAFRAMQTAASQNGRSPIVRSQRLPSASSHRSSLIKNRSTLTRSARLEHSSRRVVNRKSLVTSSHQQLVAELFSSLLKKKLVTAVTDDVLVLNVAELRKLSPHQRALLMKGVNTKMGERAVISEVHDLLKKQQNALGSSTAHSEPNPAATPQPQAAAKTASSKSGSLQKRSSKARRGGSSPRDQQAPKASLSIFLNKENDDEPKDKAAS